MAFLGFGLQNAPFTWALERKPKVVSHPLFLWSLIPGMGTAADAEVVAASVHS